MSCLTPRSTRRARWGGGRPWIPLLALVIAGWAPSVSAGGSTPDDRGLADLTAGGPRSTMATRGPRIPLTEWPGDIGAARAQLATVRARVSRGSCAWRDLSFVIGLADRYLRAGTPPGRWRTVARTVRVNAWWYSRPRQWRVQGLTVRDPSGILSTYWPCRGFAVNHVATLGRWLGMNADVGDVRLARALVPLGVERRARGRTFTVWEYYDIPDRPEIIAPGPSGMSQARLAHLFARAFRSTRDEALARAADGALRSFTVRVADGGVRSPVAWPAGSAPSPWYVEWVYPGASPWRGAALNGFMVSVINLQDAAAALRSVPPGISPTVARSAWLADQLARQGARSIRRYLPLHDSGRWSYYGMLVQTHPWRTYPASLSYHCYHVQLLGMLHRRFPAMGFAGWQRRWSAYVPARGLQCPTV